MTIHGKKKNNKIQQNLSFKLCLFKYISYQKDQQVLIINMSLPNV